MKSRRRAWTLCNTRQHGIEASHSVRSSSFCRPFLARDSTNSGSRTMETCQRLQWHSSSKNFRKINFATQKTLCDRLRPNDDEKVKLFRRNLRQFTREVQSRVERSVWCDCCWIFQAKDCSRRRWGKILGLEKIPEPLIFNFRNLLEGEFLYWDSRYLERATLIRHILFKYSGWRINVWEKRIRHFCKSVRGRSCRRRATWYICFHRSRRLNSLVFFVGLVRVEKPQILGR